MIAALKFRFNECESRGFSFKRLAKASKNKRPHRSIPLEELEELEEKSKSHPKYNLGWRMLLDLGCRVQDLIRFQFDSFEEDSNGGGSTEWTAKKT